MENSTNWSDPVRHRLPLGVWLHTTGTRCPQRRKPRTREGVRGFQDGQMGEGVEVGRLGWCLVSTWIASYRANSGNSSNGLQQCVSSCNIASGLTKTNIIMNSAVEMPALDDEGYLVEPGEWSENIANELAHRLDIELGDKHWDVIRFMRSMYEEHQVAPDARHVIKYLEIRYPNQGRNLLFELFPYGYVGQACKIAGMKRPRGWSTG